MKDEIDGWGNHISSRVPVVSKTACLSLTAVGVFLLFIIGFAIGYGSHRVSRANSQALTAGPNYVFVSNTSGSCQPLSGQRLLTTMDAGASFEGLVVNLACQGDYQVFPNQVKCKRRSAVDP